MRGTRKIFLILTLLTALLLQVLLPGFGALAAARDRSGDLVRLAVRKASLAEQLGAIRGQTAGYDYVADEVLVQAGSASEARAIAAAYGAQLRRYTDRGLAVLALPAGTSVLSAVESAADPGNDLPVVYPNLIYTLDSQEIQYLPDDAALDQQYYHRQLGNFSAWDISTGSDTVTVAVIDTGIDVAHPEFAGRISPLSYNAYTLQTGINHVQDDYGHGSHVAGIIAANQDNATGGSGVAPHVTLLVIKANNPSKPTEFTMASLLEALLYAADNGADVINLSLGRHYDVGSYDLERDVIAYAVAQGALVVCAAGNDSDNHAGYPAAYADCVAVSALSPFGLFDYSYSNYGPEIELSAPGTAIFSTVRSGDYAVYSGTSMATPMVSAAAALLKSAEPTRTAAQIRQLLQLSAIDTGGVGRDSYYGFGMIHTHTALTDARILISYDGQGSLAVTPYLITPGSALTRPVNPTRTGYDFNGWYKEPECLNAWNFAESGVAAPDLATAALTLYARWQPKTYTVAFNSQGGSAVASISAAYGSTITPPPDPTKTNYLFAGWYKESACLNAWNFAADTIAGNTTLYAKWQQAFYTVTFNSAGGTSVEPLTVAYQDLVPRPLDPIRTDYAFTGWYKEPACQNAWNFAQDRITGSTTLYAGWVYGMHQVSFESNGGSIVAPVMVVHQDLLPRPPDPERAGHDFAGWFKDQALTQPFAFATETITGPIWLYAAWQIRTYTVTFLNWDNALLDEQSVPYGSAAVAPTVPVRRGCVFVGWDTPFDSVVDHLTVKATSWLYIPLDSTSVAVDHNQALVWLPSTGMTVEELLGQFNHDRSVLRIYSKTGVEISDGAQIVSTGMTIYLDIDETIFSGFWVVLRGDVNGDGAVDALDLLRLKRVLLSLDAISRPYTDAACLTDQGEISALDLLVLKRYLLGLADIH
jgi:uncharacterized repeat protein (TIGR02543 family)